jgi:hypothetical protein
MESGRQKGVVFALLLITALLLTQCTTAQTTSTEAVNTPRSVLFVGNSVVGQPIGQDTLLRLLAGSANPPTEIKAELAIAEGKVLEALWSDPSDRHAKILSGKYDLVVLQATLSKTGTVYGGLTADTEAKFHQYAAKFDEENRKGGAQTVLFMHWQFNEAGAMSIQEISRIYREVAAERHIRVVPAGLAWQRAQKAQPGLVLLSDSVHANAEGSYLSACVLYATLSGRTPVGLSEVSMTGISKERAGFLQRIAWETVLDWKQP